MKLVVNPTSGQEQATDALAIVNTILRSRFPELDIALTATEGDHEREGARAAEDGYTHVIAMGGDGTLNGVLNGIARHPGGLSTITLGVIPAGTGNDAARALGLPVDPAGAAQRIVEERVRAIDVGVVNDRFFLNTSAGGFIAETSVRVDSALKTLAGRFAYLLGGAQTLMEYEPVSLHVTAPDVHRPDLPTHTFVVANSPFIGGGFHIAPEAALDDGLLDVCIIRATTALQFVGVMRRFSQGERLGDDEAVYFRANRFELQCDRPVWVNTDGEPVEGRRFEYRVLPGGVRFLC
jgi:diacylglycerol kinase (ATP)